MTKSRVFFWLLTAFISGIAAASFVPFGVKAIWMVFALGGAIATFGLLRLAAHPRALVLGIALAAFALGALRFFDIDRIPPSALDLAVGEDIRAEGIVAAEPVVRPASQQIILRAAPDATRILLTTRPFPAYRYGDRIRVSGRLERPENFSPDFDYAAYLGRDSIFFVMPFPRIELLGEGGGSWIYRRLLLIKGAFAANLESHLPEPHAAFMAGLLLGERQNFPGALKDALQVTGTSHVVALSGYNITIVGDALLAALLWLTVPIAAAFWIALAGIFLFTLLTGAAASVVRASIMGALVLVARREGRQYRMRNALMLAAATMLAVNPKLLRFDIGFQLSFLATLGLLYGTPMVERAYETLRLRLIPPLREARLIRERRGAAHDSARRPYLRGIFLSTLAAQIAVLPLLVYHFGRLSLVSPIANLAILPFIPATMLFGFLTGVLAFLGEWLVRLAGAVAWMLLHYELSAINAFARLPMAAIEIRGFGAAAVVSAYLFLGFVVWRQTRAMRTDTP